MEKRYTFASIKLSCDIVSYIDLANGQSYNLRNRNSSATIYEKKESATI